MRVVLIVLVVGLGGGVEAASFPGDSLTNSGVPTVDVRYYRRHPSYYYRRGGDPSTPPVTATTATRFVHYSACGQKRIGRKVCGASPIAKVRRTISKGSNLPGLKGRSTDRWHLD